MSQPSTSPLSRKSPSNSHSHSSSSKSKNNSNSSSSKQVPTSLFSKHLQPSPPPPSAANTQIQLFKRVIERRSKQLHSFSLSIHQKLYRSLTETTPETSGLDQATSQIISSGSGVIAKSGTTTRTGKSSNHALPITSSEISQLFAQLPNKKPTTNKQHYTSLILYLLTENFNSSCDSRLSTTSRTHCLNKVRFILYRIEVALTQHIKQQEEEEKKREESRLIERARQAKAKILQKEKEKRKNHTAAAPQSQSQGTAATTTATATANRDSMGSLLSTSGTATAASGVSTSTTTTASSPKENIIIVLDDDDDDDEDVNDTQRDTKVASAAAATTTTITTTNEASRSMPLSPVRKSNNGNDINTSSKRLSPPQSLLQSPRKSPIPPNNRLNTFSTSPNSSFKSVPKPALSFQPSTNIPPTQKYIPEFTSQPRQYLRLLHHHQQPQPTSIVFFHDSKLNSTITYTSSYSLYERSRCQLTFNTSFISCQYTITQMKKLPIPPPPPLALNLPVSFSSIYLDGLALDNFEARLRRWDPYWNVVCNCSTFTTKNSNGQMVEVGYKTTNVNEVRLDRPMEDRDAEPRTASLIPINVPKLNDVRWGQKPMNFKSTMSVASNHNIEYVNNEKRLIVRALPIIPNPKYKKIRSDTHQWPKGTFLQMDSRPIYPIYQRKQQQHDPSLWKGLSNILDVTEYLSLQNNLTSNLSICSKDGEMYGLQVALCEHVTPDALFEKCMRSGTKGSIEKMCYNDGLLHAMKHFEKETLVLDSDDEDGNSNGNTATTTSNNANGTKNNNGGSNSIASLTCSLICPVTMQVIKTPVRGKHCKHLNCFDLRTFLQSNSKVSGGRWRCFVCEDFISVDELVYDGFIAQVLETFTNDINTTTRDKVILMNDATWKLSDEASSSMKRNQKKRKMQENRGKEQKMFKSTNPSVETEVIDIDD